MSVLIVLTFWVLRRLLMSSVITSLAHEVDSIPQEASLLLGRRLRWSLDLGSYHGFLGAGIQSL
jgi:hypothetical protein